ncbi:MAG: recombination protein RecR [Candidatus Delongbacteria bacterium]|nr:recombination protein RecR [Candidatus Delongbacteria bacterium]MBN2835154.1 recombination protein RecR [Candidatus Delongbacteria bacterium]
MKINSYFEDLVLQFSRLPGIGKRSARSMANYIVTLDKAKALQFAEAVINAKEHLRFCEKCFNLTENRYCEICESNKRDSSLLMIVENYKDIQFIEEAGFFNGIYHVLGGLLNPLDGVTASMLKVSDLEKRFEHESFSELILGLPFSLEGDATSLYILDIFEYRGIKITRPVKGIPVGGDLSHSDTITIRESFLQRKQL